MNVELLSPGPDRWEAFRRSRERFVPSTSGCYVLASVDRTVLYVGLATNLRQRLNQHLDDPRKTVPTADGRAVLFFWLENSELNLIERTWQNIHIQAEGRLPILNTLSSPVSI